MAGYEAAKCGRVPNDDGLSMPAEWSRHRATLVSWPCREKSWRGHIAAARLEYVDVVKAVLGFEPVIVLADPATLREAQSMLPVDAELMAVELDDSWIRDNGPIAVTSPEGGVSLVDFRFNAWGLKSTYAKDDAVPAFLAKKLGLRRYHSPMVLEGGAISVDGQGTLLTTEQCLLNENRNPNLSREDIERNLRNYLGITKTIWLGEGQANDITDGHVDGVAGFFAPGKVMIACTKDDTDPNYAALRANRERLESETDSKGRSLEVMEIVQPKPMKVEDAVITPGYINHYIVNGGVVAPAFGIPEDAPAVETLRSAYPDREVVTASARILEIGGGGIHCITQQVPRE
jgi:agmatine deiminase